MKLIFFDESKVDASHPHYHIGGVCIDESDLSTVETMVARLSQEVFGTADITRHTEFHAADIFHRKKHFKHMNDHAERLAIIERLAEILSQEQVQLIKIQINRTLLPPSQKEDEVAFMFFCERANDLVRAEKSLGMLIGDRESDKNAERFSINLSGFRESGTSFQFGRKINNLVDSVHFTHSHLSRFLQLADIYTWLLQFKLRNHESTDARHKAVFDTLKKSTINLFPKKYKVWPSA